MLARMRRNIVLKKVSDLFFHHPVAQEQRLNEDEKERE